MLPVYQHIHAKNDHRLLPAVSGLAFVALVPPLHIFCLWFFWDDYARYVDRGTCTCSCWDTVFKGTYESGIASYKHFYFNATKNMFKIWLMVSVFLVISYECLRWLTNLWLSSKLRHSMALVFLSSIFSHYYSWWIYINYYNDDFYSQFDYQLFFTVTELVSSSIVLWYSNRERTITIIPASIIVGIAVFHVIAASKDQFFLNVIQGEGRKHQVIRDVGFMIPDLLQIVVPLMNIKRRTCW